MKYLKLLLLSIIAGLLLWLSEAPYGFPFLAFFAFVPLFFISDQLLKTKTRFPVWFGAIYSYPAFFIWNILTTWWIWYSSKEGATAAIVLNALFMSLIFGFWHCFKTYKPVKWLIPFIFISFWASFEYLHLNWQITWPWLNLGNIFAQATRYVQWYEYTGTFGGTIWILSLNFIIYEIIQKFISYRHHQSTQSSDIRNAKKQFWILVGVWASLIIIPILISVVIYSSYNIKKENGFEAVIVQQNTDPWEEQYRMSNISHVKRIIKTAKSKISDQTAFIIAPESAIPHNISIQELVDKTYPVQTYEYYGFKLIDTFLMQYPNANLIVGLSTNQRYKGMQTPTTRNPSPGLYYDAFNTSVCYNRKGTVGFYHKSKLVPGVEKMPYPQIFSFLENIVIDLGGTSGSLGIDSCQKAFTAQTLTRKVKIGAPICYESIFGELFGNFVKDGAEVMAVITNDAWWKDSPGHKQHFIMSKLRAIETRRYVLRAANTGTSAFINPLGEVSQETKYGVRTAIKEVVYPNDEITFYVKHGDYLARFCVALTALFLLFGTYLWSIKKFKK